MHVAEDMAGYIVGTVHHLRFDNRDGYRPLLSPRIALRTNQYTKYNLYWVDMVWNCYATLSTIQYQHARGVFTHN